MLFFRSLWTQRSSQILDNLIVRFYLASLGIRMLWEIVSEVFLKSTSTVPQDNDLTIEENEVAETWSVLGKSVLAVPNDSLILCVPGNVLHKFSRNWNVRPTGCNSLNLSSLLSSWIHFLHLPFSNHQEPPLITVTSQRLQGNGLAVSMDIFLSPIQCITSCPIACACLIDFPATTLRHLLTA